MGNIRGKIMPNSFDYKLYINDAEVGDTSNGDLSGDILYEGFEFYKYEGENVVKVEVYNPDLEIVGKDIVFINVDNFKLIEFPEYKKKITVPQLFIHSKINNKLHQEQELEIDTWFLKKNRVIPLIDEEFTMKMKKA